MPASVLTYLARRSYQDLQLLSERFGDYAFSMHYCAEMPTKDPIDGILSAMKLAAVERVERPAPGR